MRFTVAAIPENSFVANVEALAVNAVSDVIAKCGRLEAFIDSNDKTPITDGHVDVYGDTKHSNSGLLGRVQVQVKGRSSSSKKENPSFSIHRDTLHYFRNSGGGVYFLVQVRKDFQSRVVFFAILNPYKIDRMLKNGHARSAFPVAFAKMPDSAEEIEAIFDLAREQQKQGKTEGDDERLLERLRSITIHSLGEIHSDRPTVFTLADTDFAVTIETEGGLKLPIDMDLTVWPDTFVPREVDVTVRCGSVEYSRPTVRQIDHETSSIRLSPGLAIRARRTEEGLNTNIDLSMEGSLRDQLRDLDFFLEAVHGESLVINGVPNTSTDRYFSHEEELTTIRDRIGRIVELFDAIGADEALVGSVLWSDADKRTLLSLHRAIVLDQDVPATSDGYGRLDIEVGPFTIATVVSAGDTPERLRFTDAFDPTKRARFRLWHVNDEGSPEEVTNGTVYEALEVDELAKILNLHFEGIVQAYEGIGDRAVAYAAANQMVLTLLNAADMVEGPRRARLLLGAEALSDWLVANSDDKLLSRINRWQTRYRLAALSEEEKSEIRTIRRSLQREVGVDARLREACLTILLSDFGELDVILEDLPRERVDSLQNWPIWALTDGQ